VLVACLVWAPLPDADTTLAVDLSGRLDLTSARGHVRVGVWDRPEVRVRAALGARDALVVRRAGSVVSVVARSHAGVSRPAWLDSAGMKIRARGLRDDVPAAEYEVTVPRALAITVSGMYTSVTVDGVLGGTDVGTFEGEVTVTGGGPARVESVAGSITVDGARGRVDVRSMRGDLTVHRVVGDVDAKSLFGTVALDRVVSSRVTAGSYGGTVTFRGALLPRGRYELSNHSGAIDVHLRPDADLTLELAAAPDKLHLCAPLPNAVPGAPTRRRFVVGSGAALFSVDSFAGDVAVCFDEPSSPANRDP
jgi:hypothetical protein